MADYVASLKKVGVADAALRHEGEKEDNEFRPTVTGRIAAPFLDVVEKALVWASEVVKPNYYLSGNYAPVEEFPLKADLEVIGILPDCLNGEFLRVGPNPKFEPFGNYHWFDGDGMIHAVRIKNGKASYASRYVRTARIKQEEYYGAAKFMKLGDLRGKVGLGFVLLNTIRAKLGVLDHSKGTGTGNTALTFHSGKVFALHEGDKPYALRVLEDGDLQTVGLYDYGSKLNHPLTAHPKLDVLTGELFTYGYSFEKAPFVTYHVISKDGVLGEPVTITIPEPVMMHDFAITQNFAIFMDLPVVFRPKAMVETGHALQFDESRKSRFGILPRYAKNESQIRWFELPPFYVFHNVNAWEEGDEVVLYSCRLKKLNMNAVSAPDGKTMEDMGNELYEFRFNLKSGGSSQRRIGDFSADFPRINENFVGRKQRFAYISAFENVKVIAVVKVDLFAEPQLGKGLEVGNNIKGVFRYGDERYGSEAIFVPKTDAVEEDDGYLITFVYDEKLKKSEIVVIDAKTMNPQPVAIVSLPRRVPYGFHAHFVSEHELKDQK